ncbi:MAG: hypothetical protein KAS38_07080, partial [Anaerolineales bacterium]|nr:hypothetical protein [Anaerolineales bacterium]
MKTSAQLANFPRLRRNPGLAEITALLERLPEAALFVDAKSKRILGTNTKTSEITLYSRQELSDIDSATLLVNFDEATFWGTSGSESHPETLTLVRQNKTEVQVLVTCYDLSPQGKWNLITLEPVSVLQQRQAERQRRSELLESMNTISQALHETELKPALELFLNAAQKMTGASTLSIYLQNLAKNNQDFEVVRFSHYGPPGNLPEQLPALELAHLRT